MVDQGISSISNFIFVASVARTSDVKTFGAFSLAYILYGLVLGTGRALGGDVLLLRAEEQPSNVRRDCRRLLGLALLLGLFIGALLVIVSIAARGAFAESLLAMAVVLPLVLVQDALRYCFFAMRSPARAAGNDLIWLMAQLVAFAGLFFWDPSADPAEIIAAWAFGAAVAVTAGLVHARLSPKLRQVSTWLTEDRSRVVSFLADFLLMTGSNYASLYVVAIIGSVTDAGAIRGGLLLYAPLEALVAGIRVFTLPALAQSLSQGGMAMRARAGMISAGTAGFTVVWTIGTLTMPHSVGAAILGSTWDLARPLILAISLTTIARFVALPAVDGIRALGEGRRLVRLRVATTVLPFSAVVIGTALDGAQGAVNCSAGATLVAALLWWRGFLKASQVRARPADEARPAASF